MWKRMLTGEEEVAATSIRTGAPVHGVVPSVDRELGPHHRRRRRGGDRRDERVAARLDVEDVVERTAPRIPRTQLRLGDHQDERPAPGPAVPLDAAGLEDDIALLTRSERQGSEARRRGS
jgi:hypothetical protein